MLRLIHAAQRCTAGSVAVAQLKTPLVDGETTNLQDFIRLEMKRTKNLSVHTSRRCQEGVTPSLGGGLTVRLFCAQHLYCT